MTPAMSVWLDLLRLGAAGVVFLGHAGTQRVSGGLFYQFAAYGEQAVDVFFVISGFVIAYATSRRGQAGLEGARLFAVARAARVYSVVVPVLALGWLLDAAGPALGPAVYDAAPNFDGPAGPVQLASSLLFLDHLWFRAAQPGSNLPYWSLCFEAWYYLAFAALAFAPRPWNWVAAAAALLLAGPKIALLFPLWLLGLACQRLCARLTVPQALGWVLFLAPIVLAALAIARGPIPRDCFPYSPFDPATCIAPLWQDYSVGLLVAANLLGVHALAQRLGPLLARVARPIAWLAGASFTLYLLHYPLIHFLAAASPWPAGAWPTRLLVFIAAPLVVLAVAEVTERRKHAWRRAFATLAGERPAKETHP
jgi:peptidoglycan/LPS O-acetylase OafA/YrhL